jgi:hypothetical protein
MPTWNSPLQDGLPWVNESTPRNARALFRFYGPIIEGRNVYIMNDGTVTEDDPADWDDVRLILWGGRVPVEITVADAALLTEAGYGAFVT